MTAVIGSTARPQRGRPQLDVLARTRAWIRGFIALHLVLNVLLIAAVAFWAGFLVDWLPTQFGGLEMPRSARAVVLAISLATIATIAIRFLGRLLHPLPDESLALLLEKHHPHLNGRLVTTVQVRPEAQDHSPGLLAAVYRQTDEQLGTLHPMRVLQTRPIKRLAFFLLPFVIGSLVFVAMQPAIAGQAARRLLLLTDQPWPRQAQLRMVGVEVPVPSFGEEDAGKTQLIPFEDDAVLLARGANASLRVAAATEGWVVPDVCTVYYTDSEGVRGQANMRRTGRPRDGLQMFILDGPPLDSIVGNLEIDIRGLDARLDDYQIRVQDPPVVTQVVLRSEPPAYLSRGVPTAPTQLQYQSGLRLREGSMVTFLGQGSKSLADVQYQIAGEETVRRGAAEISDDGRSFQIPLGVMEEPVTVKVLPIDSNGITLSQPTEYFLNVLPDMPPTIRLQVRGIGDAVTPRVRIPTEGHADDDHRIARAVMRLTQNTPPAAQQTGQGAFDLTKDLGLQRDGAFSSEFDLAAMVANGNIAPPEPGDTLVLFAEASDYYDLQPREPQASEAYRLEVVSPDELISRLERRELALRSRLEQVIREVEQLRDSLVRLRVDNRSLGEGIEREEEREQLWQLQRLRAEQTDLQSDKNREELAGIAASVADILGELVNNRIDSVDRRQRLEQGVYQPLDRLASQEFVTLQTQIRNLKQHLAAAETGDAGATLDESVVLVEEIMAGLDAVLEGMLELESYNELLEMVRGLIDEQEELIDKTKEEQKRRVLELFQ